MKALIRKSGINGYEWEEDTIMLYPWPNGDDQGRPYTLEGYRYAMCIDAPDGEIVDDDPRLDANNYRITSMHIFENDVEHVVWVATWNPQ